MAAYVLGSSFRAAESFISFCPRRIEHHSLCSATGIPHSTQIRIRGFGGSLLPNRRFSSDMPPPGWVDILQLRWTGRPGSELAALPGPNYCPPTGL